MRDNNHDHDVQEQPAGDCQDCSNQQQPTTPELEDLHAAIDAGDFDIKAFLSEYKEALGKHQEAEQRALRVQADFDNFRRRSREDLQAAGDRATADLLAALLPVLDNFERALLAMNDSADKAGVEMIAKQLFSVLAEKGLAEIEAKGAPFDPNHHQAVAQVDAGPENKDKVVEVLQKGYLFQGKLLRATVVQVGK